MPDHTSFCYHLLAAFIGAVTLEARTVRSAPENPAPHNVIEFVLDDVGTELLALYDPWNAWPDGFAYPETPNIDAVAAAGVTFRSYWAHPICSPDRAAALTGRHNVISAGHPGGTGIGTVVGWMAEGPPLTPEMMALPFAHANEGTAYEHYHVGKWHLGFGQGDPTSPVVDGGVTEYRGCLTNPYEQGEVRSGEGYVGGYADYTQTIATSSGTTQMHHQTLWLGAQEVSDAVDILPNNSGTPFVLRYWFHYAHSPWKEVVPDDQLDPGATMWGNEQFPFAPNTSQTYSPSSNPSDPYYPDPNVYNLVHRRVKAMIEAADQAIGDVLAGLTKAQRNNTIIIIRADNGTDGLALDPTPEGAEETSPLEPPPSYDPDRAKRSIYEQGLNVPLIIGAHPGNNAQNWIDPSMVGEKVDALCSTVDVWATVAEATLPNWQAYPTDGVSLLPILAGTTTEVRDHAFSFTFSPNGADWDNVETGEAAVRNQASYKLIRRVSCGVTVREELYDLSQDPLEARDLFAASAHHAPAYVELSTALDSVLQGWTQRSTFCFGDGSGAPCPCDNENDSSRFCGRAGCDHSGDSGGGAAMIAVGSSSVSHDTLTLRAYGAADYATGIFLQGTSPVNGGLGIPFRDGLICVGGTTLQLELASTNENGFVDSSVPIGAQGGASAGQALYYQFWFFENGASPCDEGSNFTNAVEVTWSP